MSFSFSFSCELAREPLSESSEKPVGRLFEARRPENSLV